MKRDMTAVIDADKLNHALNHILKGVVAILIFALGTFVFPGEAEGASVGSSGGNGIDPGVRDTLKIDSLEGLRGGSIVAPVRMFADEALGGVTLVLTYDPVALVLDSVSFVGTLGETMTHIVTIDSSIGLLNSASFGFDNASVIQPGSGVIANLHFTITDTALPGAYVIDTTTIDLPGPGFVQTSFSTVQTDSIGNETVLPEFSPGSITVADRAATFDSVWVDTVTAAQGETVIVDVFLHNEEPLAVVNIPLKYNSPNLLFDTVLFSGTRGILAGQLRQSQVNTDSQEVLITLQYLESSPLTPGDGPIARLRFTIDNNAPNGPVSIDSAAFLGAIPLELTTTVADGSFRFTPFFHAGAVIVDFRTDVGDDDPLLPTEFSLEQNYPNPFNPTTKIPYSLPRGSDVTLEVYNLLGQRVRTLIDGYRQAGAHIVEFDGNNDNGATVSSGVYFYRIKAGTFSVTRKMTLLK